MKILVLTAVVLSLGVAAYSLAQDAGTDKTKAIMHAKLDHSKALLKGLATEDFDSLAKHADALSLLSLEADWNVIQTAEYRRLSGDFRRSTKSLSEAAEENNLDGATLAYVGVTMKCVECHKYVRSVEIGQSQ